MDKKRSALNITISLSFKVFILILEIFARRFLIRYIGNEINGLNSLYISLLDFLSIAELGVGTAITYCMYKPIVEGDTVKVAALYRLFNKLYLIIGSVILVAGCAMMPALPILAKDYQTVNVNLYLTFAIMLVSVVLSYAYSSKMSLINAHKDNYITEIINSLGKIARCAIQLLVLAFTKSFELYLIARIIAVLIQWISTEIVARKRHGDIIRLKSQVDNETKHEVGKNVKAMFMHKIGGILVNTADSIIISAFIGIVILGKYSNYTTIVTGMVGVLGLVFTSITSVVGHMFVQEGEEVAAKYMKYFQTINFLLGTVFFLGYYAVADNLINILFAENLELSKSVVMIITLNYFIQFMRQSALMFRDATGTFYYDRWKPIVEGVANIVLSILFVLIFPDEYKVVGVIVATILTNLFITHIVEPHVLYKYALKRSAKGYYIRNYTYCAVFAVVLVALSFCTMDMGNQWLSLLVNGCISLGFSFAVVLIFTLPDREFRNHVKSLFSGLLSKLKKSKS